MPRPKIPFVHNLDRTEWWPLDMIGKVKLVDPQHSGSGQWRVAVQSKKDCCWLAVHETGLMKDAQDWIEAMLK